MLRFTKEEKLSLIIVGLIFLTGTSLHYSLKRNPNLFKIINFVNSDDVYSKIDLNRAAQQDLIRIPSIGPVTADRIIEFREKNGTFTDLEQLKNVEGIGDSRYQKVRKYFTISPSYK